MDCQSITWKEKTIKKHYDELMIIIVVIVVIIMKSDETNILDFFTAS